MPDGCEPTAGESCRAACIRIAYRAGLIQCQAHAWAPSVCLQIRSDHT